jgi:hypothetical protein
MRGLACLAILFVVSGLADEQADGAGIRQTLRRLSVPAERDAQFTADADGKAHLAWALAVPHRENEPLSGDYWPIWTLGQPPIQVLKIRFVTADVALVDTRTADRPLLFVLRKEQGSWKVASIRVVRE